MTASPSPFATQSIAPSPCARIEAAVNDALWPPTADEHIRKARLRRLGEIDDLGHVRQVIAGKGDDIRPPALDEAEIGAMVLDLQIDQPHLVTRLPHRRRHQFEPQGFEPQKNLRIEERARMDGEKPHGNFSPQTLRA